MHGATVGRTNDNVNIGRIPIQELKSGKFIVENKASVNYAQCVKRKERMAKIVTKLINTKETLIGSLEVGE
jgi:hypothetical protein